MKLRKVVFVDGVSLADAAFFGARLFKVEFGE